MNDLFFFLGAKDPEMDRIEEILSEHNFAFKYATINENRVHPGNAYEFYATKDEFNKNTVFVECFPSQLKGQESNYQRIDHHRSCDDGFYMPPERFWDASSIGQLYKLISMNDDNLYNDMILAAMDHCLPEALSGKLIGISVSDVLKRRIFEISKTSKISIEDVSLKIDTYKNIIAMSPIKNIGGVELHDLSKLHLGYGYNLELLAAQTAASLIGVSVLLRHGDSPIREKMTLSGVNSVDNVIIVKEHLENENFKYIYAVPARGYCGGYF